MVAYSLYIILFIKSRDILALDSLKVKQANIVNWKDVTKENDKLTIAK